MAKQKEILSIEIVEEIYGWGYTFKDIVKQTRKFEGSKIIVPVNSYGGAVTEGMAIYNYLKGIGIDVEARIVGYAMSMGTIICCAASKVIMPENSWYMIHNPTMGKWGDKDDLESGTNVLIKMTNDLANIYQKKTGLELDHILDLMKKETWLTGQEALDYGFVDELSEGVSLKAVACADKELISQLNNIPEPIKASHSFTQNNGTMDKGFFQKLSAFFGKDITDKTTADELDQTISEFQASQSDKVSNLEKDLKDFKAKINNDLTETVKSSLGNIVQDAVKSSMEDFEKTIDDKVTNSIDEKVKPTNEKVNDLAKSVNDLKAGKSGGQGSNHSDPPGNQGGSCGGSQSKVEVDEKSPLNALSDLNIELV